MCLSSSIYALLRDRRHRLASLAKLLEGLLDDGPQFVLRLVIVVLYDIGLGRDVRELATKRPLTRVLISCFCAPVGIVFTMSMVTSFLSLILFGLHFSERDTFAAVRFLICVPMFAAFAGARAFTLAVFLKVEHAIYSQLTLLLLLSAEAASAPAVMAVKH